MEQAMQRSGWRRNAGLPRDSLANRPHGRPSGLTLIELMIVVAIASILAAIAYPSYRAYVIRSNRAEAKADLLQTAQQLERCFTRLHSYSGCEAADHETPGGHYTIGVSRLGQTFTITAVPKGSQANDTACGTLSIDQRGKKDRSGKGTLQECWQK